MTTMTASVRWNGQMQFVGRAADGPAVVLDTPEGGGGTSPMALLLMGVAGCTAMDVITILRKKRMAVTDLVVNISGTRAATYPQRFARIELEYVVIGTDIDPKGVKQAIELSEGKYCGAMASLNAEITHRFRIEAP